MDQEDRMKHGVLVNKGDEQKWMMKLLNAPVIIDEEMNAYCKAYKLLYPIYDPRNTIIPLALSDETFTFPSGETYNLLELSTNACILTQLRDPFLLCFTAWLFNTKFDSFNVSCVRINGMLWSDVDLLAEAVSLYPENVEFRYSFSARYRDAKDKAQKIQAAFEGQERQIAEMHRACGENVVGSQIVFNVLHPNESSDIVTLPRGITMTATEITHWCSQKDWYIESAYVVATRAHAAYETNNPFSYESDVKIVLSRMYTSRKSADVYRAYNEMRI